MEAVFADTGYWIALINKQDRGNRQAIAVTELISPVNIVTSEMVLAEFLSHMRKFHEKMRRSALSLASGMRSDPMVTVVPQTSRQFELAVALYSARLDKKWSITDCASFNIMREFKIRDALAFDKDFEQAGFTRLLKDP